MNYTIQNEHIILTVSDLGAEMQSIQDHTGHEYLWQGSPDSWKNKAINIFPWVARLTCGQYTYRGKRYSMSSHGFAPAAVFKGEKATETQLIFTLDSTPDTLEQYPFAFTLQIIYTLTGRTAEVEYRVLNRDENTMHYGLGGHPGFIVPMEPGKTFADYRLVFSEKAAPKRVGMSPDCYVTDNDTDFPLQNGDTLPLSQRLFDNDAIIIKDMAPAVTLTCGGIRSLTVEYPGFSYLGLWNWPTKDVEYLCIEPWTSLPARKDMAEDLETKPELLALAPGGEQRHCFRITI